MYPISNAHAPYNNVNPEFVNVTNSHTSGIPFSNTNTPTGLHTLPPTGSNIQSAAGIYPAKGGSRKRKNKIYIKYNMRKYRRHRHTKKHHRRTKSHKRRSGRKTKRVRFMRGGAFQSPATTPNYPAGHSQFQNNNGSISNTYSVGGPLGASNSALANPPPYQSVPGDVDNLNHNTLNSYGNIGAGSGFASRGWY